MSGKHRRILSSPESNRVRLTIPGTPQPKQRARKGKGGGFYTPTATKKYEAKVAWLARQQKIRAVDGNIAGILTLWFPDYRVRDADNCVKSVLDGLNKIAWNDDSQVAWINKWGEGGFTVRKGIDKVNPRAELEYWVVPNSSTSTTD